MFPAVTSTKQSKGIPFLFRTMISQEMLDKRSGALERERCLGARNDRNGQADGGQTSSSPSYTRSASVDDPRVTRALSQSTLSYISPATAAFHWKICGQHARLWSSTTPGTKRASKRASSLRRRFKIGCSWRIRD
ncbi:hypothetical protein SISSUDRAFT_886569 [Sistotremastrum suecicum HHB10207 ss-3]|uniref:Uncharacterized protein n=1 Tax=Sistotremastrum suecicum HHB10207 ss-3 TaxID=1314776 RepID=A0A166C7C0_9AGAM|nr:hypothetical protein SISSUDRAFT_886569 [Sistotremastrum suecicum HHB10207 ss-3]